MRPWANARHKAGHAELILPFELADDLDVK